MTRVHPRARWSDDRGATAVEYGVVIALIAIAIVVAVALLGRNLSGSFTSSNDAIQLAVNAGTQTPSSTPTSTPTPTSTSTQTPPPPPAATYATWERVGQSDNYRWECANGFNLGAAGNPIRLATPSGSAPACQ